MILAFGIYPLAYSLWLSFHKRNFFTRSMDFAGLLQWQAAFADPRMWGALGTTLTYTAVCLVVAAGARPRASRCCSIRDRRGYGVLRALMTLPLVVPPAVTGMMFLLMLDGSFGVLTYLSRRLRHRRSPQADPRHHAHSPCRASCSPTSGNGRPSWC